MATFNSYVKLPEITRTRYAFQSLAGWAWGRDRIETKTCPK